MASPIERLVKLCGDQICGDSQAATASPIRIFKITSELAKLSCSDETLKAFGRTGTDHSLITFSLEERNLFARLQIGVNQIRKQNHLQEIPLFHLSPRIILADSKPQTTSGQTQGQTSSSAQQDSNLSIQKSSKKNKKKKNRSEEVRPPLAPAAGDDSVKEIAPVTLSEQSNQDNGVPQKIPSPPPSPSLSRRQQKESVGEATLRTTIFSHELDPTDTEGWVPVAKKKKELSVESVSSPKKNPPPRSLERAKESYSSLRMLGDRPIPPPPTTPPHPTRLSLQNSQQVHLSPPLTVPPPSLPSPPPLSLQTDVTCESCLRLATEMSQLRSQHETEISNIRELHSQAIQALQLKLFIANNNLDLEREERNKIIEEIIRKYSLEGLCREEDRGEGGGGGGGRKGEERRRGWEAEEKGRGKSSD
jgi:hypothetical protein